MTSRRKFIATASAVGLTAAIGAPRVVTAKKTDTKLIVGEGEHKFEVTHEWPQLPDKYTWQTTHGVAVDKAGNLYVIHEGRADQKDHPSIFVFDSAGKFIRAFGEQFQGGGHGIEIREEGGEEFIYTCSYQMKKTFAKMTPKGDIVWQKYAPMDSGKYAAGEDKPGAPKWARDGFLPTNFAFLPDGGFILADGYGAWVMHRYDKDANWVSCFGGAGEGEGKFNTPHGVWCDTRPGRDPEIVVCDRANNTLQTFTLDGVYKTTIKDFGLPANCETWKGLLLVPELKARISILDDKNKVVATLGDDVKRISEDSKFSIRGDKSKWLPGKFVHPHDACFAADGSIFVAEWVGTGRVSMLKKVS